MSKKPFLRMRLGGQADPGTMEKVIHYLDGPLIMSRKLGVSRFAVYTWRAGIRNMPAEVAVRIEKLTDGLVLREELLPEIFDRSWSRENKHKNQEDNKPGGLDVIPRKTA